MGVIPLASDVTVCKEDAAVLLTLANPPVNALHPELVAKVHEALLDVESQSDVRGVIITGSGSVFAAGGDIEFFRTLNRRNVGPYLLSVHAMQEQLARLEVPVIAAVNGAALGGGCELSMACDIRIAEQGSLFGLPETSLGVIPAAGGTQNLPRMVPIGTAKRMLFTGDRLTADEALAIGLVDKVVPQGRVVDEAIELVRRIAKNAPLAVAAAKKAIGRGLQMSVADGQRIEAQYFADLIETADVAEGIDAFFDKRQPSFVGR